MVTRKFLAPIDPANPKKIVGGFLYPNVDSDPIASFLEIDSGEEWDAGVVVYVGREISKHDVFAKIVNSGKKISSVNDLLNSLDDYLLQISKFRIGDHIGIQPTTSGFELIKLDAKI